MDRAPRPGHARPKPLALPPGLEGSGPGVLRPNHSRLPEAHPRGALGGRGRGTLISDSPGLMVSLRAAGACAARQPPPPQACAALGWAPTMTPGRAWNGRLLAGVCRARLGRPIGLPACAALGRPMPRRGFDGIGVADVADPATPADPANTMGC
jgi:hypothetical protein